MIITFGIYVFKYIGCIWRLFFFSRSKTKDKAIKFRDSYVYLCTFFSIATLQTLFFPDRTWVFYCRATSTWVMFKLLRSIFKNNSDRFNLFDLSFCLYYNYSCTAHSRKRLCLSFFASRHVLCLLRNSNSIWWRIKRIISNYCTKFAFFSNVLLS